MIVALQKDIKVDRSLTFLNGQPIVFQNFCNCNNSGNSCSGTMRINLRISIHTKGIQTIIKHCNIQCNLAPSNYRIA